MRISPPKFRGVTPVDSVIVYLDDGPWLFAEQNREKISVFWRAKQNTNPHFFDGRVHVMTSWEIRDAETSIAAFVGTLQRTNFASFLYWKKADGHTTSEFDFSGGAAVLCSDGALLMAVSGEHTIIPGTLEFPSGFVEVGDFEGSKLNFDRHVEREVTEEFAITKAQLSSKKQYLISATDRVVQGISLFTVDINGTEFTQRWRSQAGALQWEISNVVAIYHPSDLERYSTQAHVKAAVTYLLT
jgi:hypothetical protein